MKIGNGFNVFVFAILESQFALLFASLPFLHHWVAPHTSVHDTHQSNGIMRRESIRNRSGRIIGALFHPDAHNPCTSTAPPQPVEVIVHDLEAFNSPEDTVRPSIETTYERYAQGQYGPPVPPKDLGHWLEAYRRDHGQMVRGYPF